MSRKVFYAPSAKRELFEAEDHYNLERPGLGSEFLDIVAEALRQIAEYPESSPVIRGGVRRKVLRRFPYSVLYFIQGQEIQIIAVAHQKQRPSYWWGRIG